MMTNKTLKKQYITKENIGRKLKDWLGKVAPYQPDSGARFNPRKSALIVVDMTKAFADKKWPLASPNATVVVPRVRKLVNRFHAARRPVIWAVQAHRSVAHDRGDLLSKRWPVPILEGSEGAQIAKGLRVGKSDKVIIKRRYSAFYQTDLELTLKCLKVDNVVICGLLTNMCPYLTAMDAFMRGYKVFYVADGTASLNEELHVNALCNIAGWAGRVIGSDYILQGKLW